MTIYIGKANIATTCKRLQKIFPLYGEGDGLSMGGAKRYPSPTYSMGSKYDVDHEWGSW